MAVFGLGRDLRIWLGRMVVIMVEGYPERASGVREADL